MNDPIFLALAAIFLLVGVVIVTHPKVYRAILGDSRPRRRSANWRQRL